MSDSDRGMPGDYAFLYLLEATERKKNTLPREGKVTSPAFLVPHSHANRLKGQLTGADRKENRKTTRKSCRHVSCGLLSS